MRQVSKTVKILISIFFLLGILVVYKLFFVNPPSQQEEIKVVEVEEVQPKDIKESIHLIGTVEPKYSTVFFAKSKGAWEPLVKEGASVKKGTLIGQIESSDAEKKYLLSKNAEKIAHDQHERASILSKKGYLTKQGLEEKKNAWILAQKESSTTKIDLEKTQFYAPFDGIVGVFKARAGMYVNEGDTLVSFYDPSDLIVRFDIPSSVVPFVKEGQPLEIMGKNYELTHVQKFVDDETHMCPSYVEIQGEDYVIGSAIGVDLTVKEKKKVLVIPFEAIFIQNGETCIYRVENGKASLSKVEIGFREKNQIEILSGINQGDLLILRGQQRLYPGASVKIYEAPSPSEASQMPSK